LFILKKIALALPALFLAVTLTGCSPALSLACEPAAGGSQVNSVEVTGASDEQPKVTFASPISAEEIQSKVVFGGNGNVFTGRNLIEFEIAVYNGATGELVDETAFDGSNPGSGFYGPDSVPNFCSALVGAKEGSRVVSIFPAMDAHNGQGVPELGIGPNDAFVFVFQLTRVYLAKAEGSSVPAVAGMPTVVTTPEGIPGVTIPKTEAPAELKVAQLVKGNGAPVKAGDMVTMHYRGFVWAGGSKFDSSWDRGKPAQFAVPGGLIEGFVEAVVGQTVGSQVLMVIPPSLGYGSEARESIPADSTLIFVVDILGTSSSN
jgi:peptidylprolyl isomerase